MSDIGNTLDAPVDDDAGNRVEGGLARAALLHIVESIVDDPDSVVIDTDVSQGAVMLRVHCAPDDKGKLIGRRGRIAMATRAVVRAVGSRENVTVSVDIADD